MIYQVFAVKDSKAAAFALPFFLPRMELAIRSFKDAVGDPKHEMHRHPEDYSLWCLGEYDDEKGAMQPVEPIKVASAVDDASGRSRAVSDEIRAQEDHINGNYGGAPGFEMQGVVNRLRSVAE